jgi:paraquat-inducible protein B
VRVAVRYAVQPDRIANNQINANTSAETVVRELVKRGMRARLTSSNLITGAQTISLDPEPNAPPAEMGVEDGVLVIPSLPGGGLESIASSASALLRKLDEIPFDQIGLHLNDASKGLANLMNGPQLRESLVSLQAALAEAQQFIRSAQHDAAPALARLPAIASNLQDAVARASKLVGSADEGYGADSRFKRDLDHLLSQLSDTAQSIRVLADLLTRHPEALIRGRANAGVE